MGRYDRMCEIFTNETNNLIVPRKNPKLLTEAVLRILNNEGLARRISQKGVETAIKFTYGKAISKFEGACIKLLDDEGNIE